jgi:hypothetical protein
MDGALLVTVGCPVTTLLGPVLEVCVSQHVAFAANAGAVEILLISDALLRSTDPAERRFYVQVSEDVVDNGGSVSVFSSSHASGEALTEITGIAAICRAALPGLDEMIDGEDARTGRSGSGGAAAAAAAAGSAVASSSSARGSSTAMAALVTAADGSVRLRDGAESVTTADSSDVGWELADGDGLAAAACRAEVSRAVAEAEAGAAAAAETSA